MSKTERFIIIIIGCPSLSSAAYLLAKNHTCQGPILHTMPPTIDEQLEINQLFKPIFDSIIIEQRTAYQIDQDKKKAKKELKQTQKHINTCKKNRKNRKKRKK